MKRPTLFTLLALALTTGSSFAQQTYTETFDNGSNEGSWTYGPPTLHQATGGNPGAYIRVNPVDTFAPEVRTTGGGNQFVGDWRARGVSSFGLDVIVNSTQFQALRECTLLLRSGSSMVYWLGQTNIPQPGTGWASFDFAIDSASATMPAGWAVGPNTPGNADTVWNDVITNVTQVAIFYGHPEFFYIFDQWDTGIDNARITEAGGSLGTNYCTAVVNSSGQAGVITATGSDVVADNDLTLTATQLPANKFGYFLASQGQAFVANPGGSQGNLCLAQPLGRFAALMQNSGPAGEISITADLTNIPLLGPVLAGESWNFQCWFRDNNPGSTSNFTDGVEIAFQ